MTYRKFIPQKGKQQMRSTEGFFLYKYDKINATNKDYIKDIFTQNRISFVSPATFNDPFDCKIHWSSLIATDAEYGNRLRRHMRRRNQNLTSLEIEAEVARMLSEGKHRNIDFLKEEAMVELQKIVDQTGVFCLTKRPDNILMWSYYAAGHTGFCLEFKFDDSSDLFRNARQVTYSTRHPKINFVSDNHTEQIEAVFFTKACDWIYEKEWRIIDNEQGVGIYPYDERLLTGVIFGCQMSTEDKRLIREWCGNRIFPLAFYQAKKGTEQDQTPQEIRLIIEMSST